MSDNENKILIIPQEVYRTLGPLEQIAAQVLQKVGKVKILYVDPRFKKFKNLQINLSFYTRLDTIWS